MELNDYLKERNIPSDSLEANSIVEGFQLAKKVFGGIPRAFKVARASIFKKSDKSFER